MKHFEILKRSWKLLWGYRALWIFGVLLALTAPSAQQTLQYSFNQNDLQRSDIQVPAELQQWFAQLDQQWNHAFTGETGQLLVGVGIALACLLLVVIVASIILRFTSEGALIGMVDQYEGSGERLRGGQGWKLGWAKAGRLFLTDLAVKLPTALAFIVLFGCAALPVIPALVQNSTVHPLAVATTIGLVFIVGLAAFVVGVVVSVWLTLAFRASVLENAGVGESLRRGWKLLRAEWKNTGLMWLLLVGVRLVFGLGMVFLGLLMAAGALVLGGGLGLLIHAIAGGSLLVIEALSIVVFLLLLAIPLVFAHGLLQTYLSSSWTLAYRELTLAALPEGGEEIVEG